MKSAFTTDRSTFIEDVADKHYICSGCGLRVDRGARYFHRPFAYKRKQTGRTRLHNLDSCWEDWDEKTINSIISARENGVLRKHGPIYLETSE